MSADDADAALRHFERDTLAACLAMTVAGFLLITPWRGLVTAARVALGVLGGGLLVAISYRAIKGAANLLVRVAAPQADVGRTLPPPPAREPGRATARSRQSEATADRSAVQGGSSDPPHPPVLSPGQRAFLSVKFFTRYALLAVAAYAMLTCFRLHPVGVLAGVTSPFVAALMQVARTYRAPRPHS